MGAAATVAAALPAADRRTREEWMSIIAQSQTPIMQKLVDIERRLLEHMGASTLTVLDRGTLTFALAQAASAGAVAAGAPGSVAVGRGAPFDASLVDVHDSQLSARDRRRQCSREAVGVAVCGLQIWRVHCRSLRQSVGSQACHHFAARVCRKNNCTECLQAFHFDSATRTVWIRARLDNVGAFVSCCHTLAHITLATWTAMVRRRL